MMNVIDVIIPVYRRQEFIECIKSLQQAAYLIKNIIICSDDIRSLKSQLDKFNSRIPIKYIKESFSQFNKSVLVNSGIMQSKADYILCSDADIIWNLETIESLLKNVMNKEKIAYIQQVFETQPQTEALTYKRYTYNIKQTKNNFTLNILHDQNQEIFRPGYGLIMASRHNMLKFGGLKLFSGWGWEDVDVLIRGKILGLKTVAVGSVLHISHPRPSYEDLKIKRNQNIIQSLREIKVGKVFGPLSHNYNLNCPLNINIWIPPELTDHQDLGNIYA